MRSGDFSEFHVGKAVAPQSQRHFTRLLAQVHLPGRGRVQENGRQPIERIFVEEISKFVRMAKIVGGLLRFLFIFLQISSGRMQKSPKFVKIQFS